MNAFINYCYIIFLITFIGFSLNAQHKEMALDANRFIAYGKIPTWTALAANWHTNSPTLHFFDTKQYKGHATFVQQKLKGCKDFNDFKNLVREPTKRQYLPFILYDLRQLPVMEKQKKYLWALLLQDYHYTDDDKSMQQTILQLANLIPEHVHTATQNGIIILSKNKDNKVHQRLKNTLEAAGYLTMTLDEMVKKTGGLKQQILNEGTAIGRLMLVNTPQEAEKLGYNDIPIYTYIPLDVPPVAGIITLQPQTPLSHTAILAKNRGTPNVYVHELKAIKQADKLIDKNVIFKASGNNITVELAPNQIPTSSLVHQKKVDIPTASYLLGNKVYALNQLPDSLIDIAYLGTKATNYAKLQQLFGKEYVRPGFVIGYQVYQNVVSQEAKPYIEQLLEQENPTQNKLEINQNLENIRQCILESKVPKETIQSLRKLLTDNFPYSRIRLRSSTNCEDLPQFNGAGLYDSQGVSAFESDKKLVKALLRVYASLWNEKAFWERNYFAIQQEKVAMAIHINEAFDNDNEFANGVILTKNTNNQIDILVNTQASNTLITNPTGKGEVPEAFHINAKTKQIASINTYSSIENVLLNNAQTQFIIPKLAYIGEKAHYYFAKNQPKYGVDMEFKIVCLPDGSLQLFVKQARLLRQ